MSELILIILAFNVAVLVRAILIEFRYHRRYRKQHYNSLNEAIRDQKR